MIHPQPAETTTSQQNAIQTGDFLIGNEWISFLHVYGTVSSCPVSTKTLLLIVSAPTNPIRRKYMRNLWMRRLNQGFVPGVWGVFLLGHVNFSAGDNFSVGSVSRMY
jgi:hypothetical protein